MQLDAVAAESGVKRCGDRQLLVVHGQHTVATSSVVSTEISFSPAGVMHHFPCHEPRVGLGLHIQARSISRPDIVQADRTRI